jgi:mRNA deadenylase, exonuclease subunit and related nucleases
MLRHRPHASNVAVVSLLRNKNGGETLIFKRKCLFRTSQHVYLFSRFHFKGIIDYIFYSKQNMTPLGLLGPLNQDWLKENKVIGCPHPHIPSGKNLLVWAYIYRNFETRGNCNDKVRPGRESNPEPSVHEAGALPLLGWVDYFNDFSRCAILQANETY